MEGEEEVKGEEKVKGCVFVITYGNIKPPYQPKAAVMSGGRMCGRGGVKRREGEGTCLLFEKLNVSCCKERGRGRGEGGGLCLQFCPLFIYS